jgi:hypothetical protein
VRVDRSESPHFESSGLLVVLAGFRQCLRRWSRWRNGRKLVAAPEGVPTQRDRLITLQEQDYQYGVGPLRLRLESVDFAHPLPYDGEDWYLVDGVQIGADGTELGRRHVFVRGSRLRK